MLFQALFLFVYDAFLKKETFFTKNRFYLLFTAMVSFLIPLIEIPSLQESVPSDISILLPEIVLSPQNTIEQTFIFESTQDSISYGSIAFWMGLTVFFTLFVFKLAKLVALIRKNAIQKEKGYLLVNLPKTRMAFSFFNYIFLGSEIEGEERKKIIAHEMVHWKQKHSLDLLLFEFLKIVMWFNPLIYVFQKRITTIHEYLSDAIIIKEHKKETYINEMLSKYFDVESIAFVNQFYKHSLLKKRIMMMKRNKSKQVMMWKYVLLAPILMSMVLYISCSDAIENVVSAKSKTAFYDAEGKPMTREAIIAKFKEKNLVTDAIAKGEKTYFDYYYGEDHPAYATLVTLPELSPQERKEYQLLIAKQDTNTFEFWGRVGTYRLPNGRKMLTVAAKYFEPPKKSDKKYTATVFPDVDQIPTFPGCEENDRQCFNKKMQKHIATTFDPQLPNKLNLPSGTKRIVMAFKIDVDGAVKDIDVKSPHPELTAEATRIISQLPVMGPAKKEGKNVAVTYALPMRIDVN